MQLLFIEIPEFVSKFDKYATDSDMRQLQDELITNPCKGKLVQGTGGARKLRMKIPGKGGKSGGARVIYYYVDLQGEIWLLDFYLKSSKNDLNETEKKKMYQFIKEIIHGPFK